MKNGDSPLCKRTYCWLSITSKTIGIEEFRELEGIESSWINVKGDTYKNRINPSNSWSLTTKNIVWQPDVNIHVKWLTKQLEGKENVIARLCEANCNMGVVCYWWSKSVGPGGPVLDVRSIRGLGKLGIPIAFACYFDDAVPQND